jgi:hypothetical protein
MKPSNKPMMSMQIWTISSLCDWLCIISFARFMSAPLFINDCFPYRISWNLTHRQFIVFTYAMGTSIILYAIHSKYVFSTKESAIAQNYYHLNINNIKIMFYIAYSSFSVWEHQESMNYSAHFRATSSLRILWQSL